MLQQVDRYRGAVYTSKDLNYRKLRNEKYLPARVNSFLTMNPSHTQVQELGVDSKNDVGRFHTKSVEAEMKLKI